MGYILYGSVFTVVIRHGNRHGALLRVNILLLTIFVMKSSHNHVLSRNVFIREGTFTFFIISGYLFFSFCGFYLYKMYNAKKITQAYISTPVNVRFSFL